MKGAAIGPTVPLQHVASLMRAHAISTVAVVDGNDELLGVVSEREIVQAALRGTGMAERLWRTPSLDARPLAVRTAAQVVTEPAITIGPERSLAEAAWLMMDRDVDCLPVVRDRRLIGMISRSDIIRVLAEEH